MNVQVESTIRGVSYEEPRDRWRCFHRRLGKPTLQLRFHNQYDAVWKKIELCADEGTFPFVKTVKESDTTLPVGLRYGRYGPTARPFVGAILPVKNSSKLMPFYYRDYHFDSLFQAVKDAGQCRFEYCMQRLSKELAHFPPAKQSVIHKLERNAQNRLHQELELWASSFNEILKKPSQERTECHL